MPVVIPGIPEYGGFGDARNHSQVVPSAQQPLLALKQLNLPLQEQID
ncbi:MAG: hypothetical protein WCK86_15065 [Planctomycetia bacterium]